jgi:hypothetical protein
MSIRLIAAALIAVALAGLSRTTETSGARTHPASSPDTYVTYWDNVGSQAFTAAALTPAEGVVIFANVGIAVYDAVMAIDRGYEPFTIDIGVRDGASAEAAVVAAAHAILEHYLPGQETTIIDPAYDASVATIPDGQAKADGLATGEQVAALLIAERADDGFRAQYIYTPPNPPIPGVWIPTVQAPPTGTYLPHMRPFSIDSPDEFRPGGPPPLSSRRWADEYNEVKEIGSRTSTTRTSEQTTAARFWGEPPIQQARSSFRLFVVDHQLDVAEASRFMAMVSVIDLTIPSLTGLGDRHFDRVSDLEYEVTNARIWGGIHYRSAVEDGTKIGMKVAHQVLAHHFHRAEE